MSAISLSALSFADLIAMRDEICRRLARNMLNDEAPLTKLEFDRFNELRVELEAEIKRRLI